MGIGPLAQAGLDEAFGFAVGAGREGARVAVAEAGLHTVGIEGAGPVAAAVVGQHAADLDAEMLVVGEGGGEKRRGTGGRLVGVDLREGHAGMVIHADMDVFPAGAWTGATAVVGDAVAGAAKPAEFLDIEVQQVAGMRMFVTADGRRRVEGGQLLETLAAEDATDRRGRHVRRGADVGATPAAPAQRHDLGRDQRRQCPGLAVWPRAAVAQPVRTLGLIAGHPLAHRAGTDPDGDGHRGRGLALVEHPPDEGGSTLRRQLGIPMDVHSGLLPGNGWRSTISFLGRGRVNNLLKDHS